MTRFNVNFSEPWFLLLLIPAVFLTFLPYFRSPKKYRRNRNRIVSMALHLTVMVLSISVLAGMTFEYDVPNKENEVILLVDKSDSGELSENEKNEFVYEVIQAAGENFKVGVVTFGYDQVYAAELSNDTKTVYNEYLNAQSPNTSATNIAAALDYASTLFERPDAGRIVLLSDGIETDGTAKSVIKSVAAKGIKVDTVHFPDAHGDEVMIVSSTLPDYTIRHGEAFPVTVEVQSSYDGDAVLTMYDDATAIGESVDIKLVKGTNTYELDAILPVPGLHKLSFEITVGVDTLRQNNTYNTYVNIEVFDKILIVESILGESESLRNVMSDKKITVVNSHDTENMPKTVEDLRNYDEVILVNVANADMPAGFIDILHDYVYNVGGGLFTVCGNKEDSNPNDDIWEANAFTREDMRDKNGPTTYQKLLPVEVINYTPPVAVIIVVDTSGSMYADTNLSYEKSKLFAAKQGVEACLDALTERDYIGIVTFEENYHEVLKPTPCTERNKILSAIDDIPKDGGATYFTPALEGAGNALSALSDVERRHIILVTDGQPGDEETQYGPTMRRNAKNGITMSIVGIECSTDDANKMRYLLKTYAGMPESNYHGERVDQVATAMRGDLEVPEIKDINYGEFVPEVNKPNHSVMNGVDTSLIPALNGFYGTKPKEGVDVVLEGEFVPIYAQWKPKEGTTVAKGTVGSFLCDLNGTWSGEFLNSDTGKLIINNMVASLFPSESIRNPEIRLTLKEQNYNTQMNIFTDVPEGGKVEVKIIPKFATGEERVIYPMASDGFSRVSFDIMEPGVYVIEVTKTDADGNIIASSRAYKSFSYSQEYNPFHNVEENAAFLAKLSEDGDGEVLKYSNEVFENVVKFLHNVIDPRIIFIIIALTVFLLDVASRKFKWKWPHEIIRDRKAQKAGKL